MTDIENVLPNEASFRGVVFEVPSDDLDTKRDYARHIFPGRDTHLLEETGLGIDRLDLEVEVIGDDWRARADDLTRACRQPGPGTLIHPWYGSMEVVCTGCRRSQRLAQLGKASFRLTFEPPGLGDWPRGRENTAAAVEQAAQEVEEQNIVVFTAVFQPAGLPAWSLSDLSGLVLNVFRLLASELRLTSLAVAESVLLEIIGTASLLAALITEPPSFAVTLRTGIRAALDLFADDEEGPVSAADIVAPVTNSLAAARSALLAVIDNSMSLPEIEGGTAVREQQALCQSAMQDLLITQGLAELARMTVEAEYTTGSEALAAVADLASRADEWALDARPEADPEPLRQLVAATRRHIEAVASRLPELSIETLASPVPADVWAWRRDGSLARADALTRRNNIVHPDFVPAGEPLEVLDAP